MGSEGDGYILMWMNKNCFSEKVRLEQRSTRKEGKWDMDLWGYDILQSEKLKFKIF